MQKKIEDELKEKITNLDLDEEADRGIYDEIYKKSGAEAYREELRQLVRTHENLTRYSRAQLEEKYRGIVASYVDCRIETIEWITLLRSLDLKVSRVVGILEVECEKFPLKHGELAQLLDFGGLFADHKFYAPVQDSGKKAEPKKPKRDRGHLKLMK